MADTLATTPVNESAASASLSRDAAPADIKSYNWRVTCEPLRDARAMSARLIKYDVHVSELTTCDEYIGALDNAIADKRDKHPIYGSSGAAAINKLIDYSIANGNYKISAPEAIHENTNACSGNVYVNIEFYAGVTFAGQIIRDSLIIQCKRIEQNDDARKVRIMSLELERVNALLAKNVAIARNCGITSLIVDAEHKFGAIPDFQWDYAQEIFTAEFDERPIIHDIIDLCGSPYIMPWARSVIRIIHISPLIKQRWIHEFRCARLIVETTPTDDDVEPYCHECQNCHSRKLISEYSPKLTEHDGYTVKIENNIITTTFRCKKIVRHAPELNQIAPDVRELFITAARAENDTDLIRGKKLINSTGRIKSENKHVAITIDEQIRPEKLSEPFTNARIVNMKGRDLRTFELETLDDELKKADRRLDYGDEDDIECTNTNVKFPRIYN